ncbi:MAG TPA: hypothetical protein VJ598_07535, partial [Albitalea sp.]|nr:hypothetical protein [Albitalea sp.]
MLTKPHAVSAVVITMLLAACAQAGVWPPLWQDAPAQTDFTQPSFEPPSATHCHRPSSMREVPGGGSEMQGLADRRGSLSAAPMLRRSDAAPAAEAKSAASPEPWWPPQPTPMPAQRPAHETVTAGMVDDNADFGEYLRYRERKAG